MKRGWKRRMIRWLLIAAAALFAAVAAVALLNGIVIWTANSRTVTPESAATYGADCVLVLGAGLKKNGEPGNTLTDRLDTAIALYEAGAAKKLLMSGDHGRESYDEVNLMKQYAVERGVPSRDVFMDHAGFSTYESVYRAQAIFLARRVIIVTQVYHLPRALFIAKGLGLDAVGVRADRRAYVGMTYSYAREIAARVKDCFTTWLKPTPTYLGEPISIAGDGNLTND